MEDKKEPRVRIPQSEQRLARHRRKLSHFSIYPVMGHFK